MKQKKATPTRTEVFDDYLSEEGDVSLKSEANDTKKAIKSSAETDNFDWLEVEEKEARRIPMTFTLKPEVIALIEKAAGIKAMSRSRIIEQIARKALSKLET